MLAGGIPIVVPPDPRAAVVNKGAREDPLVALFAMVDESTFQATGMGTAAIFEGELAIPEASTLSTM